MSLTKEEFDCKCEEIKKMCKERWETQKCSLTTLWNNGNPIGPIQHRPHGLSSKELPRFACLQEHDPK
jgi:hypothetical protein